MRKHTILIVLTLTFFLMIGTLFLSTSVRANFIQADVKIAPDSLLLEERNQGKWITACIGLPEGYDMNDINVSSITLDVMGAHVTGSMHNIQGNILMVKFDRSLIISLLLSMSQHMTPHIKQAIPLEVTGTLNNGNAFRGSDTIRVFIVQL